MRRRVFLAGAAALLPATALADGFDPIPAGTALTIGDPMVQQALILSGQVSSIPFAVTWANIEGGPHVNQAIRAHAVDIGSGANVPPLWAHWTGLDVKIVAVWGRQDPLNHPIYKLGVAPGVNVRTLADLRGKRIAFAPGQAQGLIVLRALASVGLKPSDVQLIQMPSTTNVYVNALASKEVDVAPLGEVFVKRYLAGYARDGGTAIAHGLRDDINVLYGPTSSVQDPAKGAAVASYVQIWARAIAWINANPQAWAQGYYVQNQGLSLEDANYLVQESGKSLVPASWDEAIAQEQQVVQLFAPISNQPVFDASVLFDRRFEAPAAVAFAKASGAHA